MKRSDGFSSNAASERDGFSEDQHVDIPRLHEEIRRLTELEEDEKKTGASKEEGWTIGENTAAYSAACKLFLELEKDHLNSQEIAALEKAYLNITSLKDDTVRMIETTVRMIETAAQIPINHETEPNVSKIFGRALLELSQGQYNRLKEDDELYLNYGFSGEKEGHYEVIKISSSDQINHQITIYNAGAEAESANKEQQRVKAITRYNNVLFNSAEDLKNFIIAVQKRQFIKEEDPEFPIISKYIKDVLGEAKAFDHNSGFKQTRGNCTTRSIREALKDMLPDDLFKKLYGFVSNEEIINRSVRDFANKHLEQKIEPDYTIQNQISRNIAIELSTLESSSAQYRFKQTSKPEGTLLHYALFKNNSGLVDKLMTLGMTGEEIDRAGDSALLYAVKHNKIGLFNQIIDSSQGNISDLLTQTNRYGQSVILTAIDNGNFEVINQCINSHIDINPERNNGYSIIKLLADKAEEVEPAMAIDYLSAINKIFTQYDAGELNLYAKDGKNKDLLATLYKQYSKNSSDPDLLNQLEEAIFHCYQLDIHSGNAHYISSQTSYNEAGIALKIMNGIPLEGEDIQTFGSCLQSKNNIIFKTKLLKGLRSGDQSMFNALIDLNDPQLNFTLCSLAKLNYIKDHLDKSLVEKLVKQTVFNNSDASKKSLNLLLKKYFSPDEMDSISRDIQWKSPSTESPVLVTSGIIAEDFTPSISPPIDIVDMPTNNPSVDGGHTQPPTIETTSDIIIPAENITPSTLPTVEIVDVPAANLPIDKKPNQSSAIAETINTLIKEGSGYLWDQKEKWDEVKKIIDAIPEQAIRVQAVNEALEHVENITRREQLISLLPEGDKALVINNVKRPSLKEIAKDFIDTYGGVADVDFNSVSIKQAPNAKSTNNDKTRGGG